MGFDWIPGVRSSDTDPRSDAVIELDENIAEFFEFMNEMGEKHMELEQAVEEYDQYGLSKPKQDIERLVPELYEMWVEAETTANELQAAMEDVFDDPQGADKPPDIWKVYNKLGMYADIASQRIEELQEDRRVLDTGVDAYIEYWSQLDEEVQNAVSDDR